MELQYFGLNCLVVDLKNLRIIFDLNTKISDLAKKLVRPNDVVLFSDYVEAKKQNIQARLILNCPGEYEIENTTIVGFPMESHIDSNNTLTSYKITTNNINLLLVGNVSNQFTGQLIEDVGMVDILVVPVGGHGFTLDPKAALEAIKKFEPKIIVPVCYDDGQNKSEVPLSSLDEALSELGMEVFEKVDKLKIKSNELLSEETKLIVLNTSKI